MQDPNDHLMQENSEMDAVAIEMSAIEVQATQTGCPTGYISYVISRGQTLYGIAQLFNTTVNAILAANPNLNPALYYEGDTICIPQGAGACQGGTNYTVQRGDSFYLIARRFGVALADILAANPGVEPNRLMVGQVICVPSAQPQPSACPTGYSTHTVTQGQTYADILILYNISYNALAQANMNTDLNNLVTGARLCIAPNGTRGNCAAGRAPYVIQRGDTLTGIAASNNTTVGAILRTNPVFAPTDFVTGRILCLP